MDEMEELKKKYVDNIPNVIGQMEKEIQSLHQKVSKESLATLRMIVHKTAGNAGTFGFQAVTDLCRGWDSRLSKMVEEYPKCEQDTAFVSELDGFLKEIKEKFAA